jgi:uncharacterized protein YceH (UPF0502 family)
MTIQETAQQLRQEFFKQAEQEAINNCNEKEQLNNKIKDLEEKINKLEKVIVNLNIRLMALEEN